MKFTEVEIKSIKKKKRKRMTYDLEMDKKILLILQIISLFTIQDKQ